MSSRREVFITILALSQRKTLIETKNHIKMFKMALFDCAFNEKCCSAVLTEDGAFALFLRPHPQEFAIQGKKMLMRPPPPFQGGGLGAGGID